MKNYAEQLAYLFFRLNGFFLIDNYVSHASETEHGSHADSDLLAIRPPYVNEIIGLNDNKDIENFLGVSFSSNKWVAIICEVKAGDTIVANLNNGKIKSCLRRIGVLSSDVFDKAIEELKSKDSYSTGDVTIIKVLVSRVHQRNVKKYKHLSTEQIITFIRNRVKKFPEKSKAWNHYGSEIMQLILTENL